MSTREGLSQFSLSWWLCAHSKLGRTKSARKLPKQKHSPPFCFPFLPLDVTGKTQKFQDKFESDLFGRFWGHMYTHDIRTIWKVIVINVLIVISWTFLVTPHSFRVLITIEQGIAVDPLEFSEKTPITFSNFSATPTPLQEWCHIWTTFMLGFVVVSVKLPQNWTRLMTHRI